MLEPTDDIRLRDLVLFDRLVALGSIAAAARALGLAKPTASRWIGHLEDRVGRPLLNHGARAVTLTDAGRTFHESLQPALRSLGALRASTRSAGPGGMLRVSVPVPFARLVGGGVIAAFQEKMPGVRLQIVMQNTHVDLIEDRIDLAIRGGPLPDSSLIARRLVSVPLWLYRSARFEDAALDAVPLIAVPGDENHLAGTGSPALPPTVLVDDRTAVLDALVAGGGVGILPAFLGEPGAAAGVLIREAGPALATLEAHAVLLAEQRRDVRLRALVDIIEDSLGSWAAMP
jgi:DNA-binding transcriptional LysR family regulator